MFSNVYPCIRPSVEYDSSLKGANTILHVCSTESLVSLLSRLALFGGKHVMPRIQLLFSMVALFVRIELLCGSIRRFNPNRANRVVYSKVDRFGATRLNDRIQNAHLLALSLPVFSLTQ